MTAAKSDVSFIHKLIPSGTSHLPLRPFSNSHSPLYADLTSIIASAQLHPVLEALLHILNNDLSAAHFLVRKFEGEVPLRYHSTKQTGTVPFGAIDDPQQAGRQLKEASANVIDEAPKVEGMLLHGILHRIEGDYENAKAWYRDVFDKSHEYRQRVSSLVKAETWDTKDEAWIQQGDQRTGTDAFSYVWHDGIDASLGFVDGIRDWRLRWEPAYRRIQVKQVKEVPDVGTDATRRKNQRNELTRLHERELRLLWEWCEVRYGLDQFEDASDAMRFGKEDKYSQMAGQQIVGGEGWRKF